MSDYSRQDILDEMAQILDCANIHTGPRGKPGWADPTVIDAVVAADWQRQRVDHLPSVSITGELRANRRTLQMFAQDGYEPKGLIDDHSWMCLAAAAEALECHGAARRCREQISMPVLILNTAIVTADGDFTVRTVTPDEAMALLPNGMPFESAVGHPATAAILTTLLEREVPVSRHLAEQQVHQRALVFKLNGRPEGQELDRDAIEAIGYSYKIIERTA